MSSPSSPSSGRARVPGTRQAVALLAAATTAIGLLTAVAGYDGRHPASDVLETASLAPAQQAERGAGTGASPSTTGAPTPTTAAAAPTQAAVAPKGATAPSSTAAPTTSPSRTLAQAGTGGATSLLPQVVPNRRGALPIGKGMWMWQPSRSDGGDVHKIVFRAVDRGISHIYVRTGSSWQGFYAQDFLNRILPVAHANGVRIIGWDFPNLRDWKADAERSLAAIRYTTPDGHRIDGFAADIETGSEGTRLSPEAALAYGTYLRQGVGNDYPLIACVPRPSKARANFPYPHVVAQFDAIAPMVYWLNREAGSDVGGAMDYLAGFGKPLMPVGQAYDGAAEGGRPGVPRRDELLRFMDVAQAKGAVAVSFWSWQSANDEAWDAIRDAPWFLTRPPRTHPSPDTARMITTQLRWMGYDAPLSSVWDTRTVDAIKAYQRDAGIEPDGQLNEATYRRLLAPAPPPIKPML